MSMAGYSYADCEFMVTNNSKESLTVEVGFFNKNKTTFSVQQAMTNNVVLKNDDSCRGVTQAGLGMTYINLIGGQSVGGWVYEPVANMFKAIGVGAVAPDGRIGISPKGNKLFLLNTGSPADNQFVVQIKSADRNISRQFGSMD